MLGVENRCTFFDTIRLRMTKSELIERVAEVSGLTKGRAELVVNTIFDSMVNAMVRNEGIEIRGFGSFTVRQYRAYEGRNPRTGELVHVPPKRLPFFKVGKDLRERVNGNAQAEGPRTRPAREEESGPRRESKSRRRPSNLSEDVI